MSLHRLDEKPIGETRGEIRAFSVVRNESRFLSAFLEAHFRMGVDRWFVVDNGSSDGTLEQLLALPSVHVFQTEESYGAADCGHHWIRQLLNEHGTRSWNLVLDADERLVLPDENTTGLPAFVRELERDGADALETLLIDVYGSGPIAECAPPGVTLDDDWFFDHPAAWPRPLVQRRQWHGGVRNRLFGLETCITKVPLFRGGRGFCPTAGTHTAPGATFGPHRGAVLHFKLVDHFARRAAVEANRGEHWSGAREYVRYEARMAEAPRLSAFHREASVRWSPEAFRRTGIRRWRDDERVTVLLPVRDGARFLPEALESLAAQTWKNFEVLAWDNGSSDSSAAILHEWIPSRLPGRVVTDQPLPLGECLAAMVETARTELCARFDADDVCEPERLETQVKELGARPDIVVLGAQPRWIDATGRAVRGAPRLPTEPVEILHGLLSTNMLHHPSVMFRRHAVVAAGNYVAAEPGEPMHFEDYDLWLRVARRFQMANLPRHLVRYRVHAQSVMALAEATGLVRDAAARCFAKNAGALAGLSEPTALRWFMGTDPNALATAQQIERHFDSWATPVPRFRCAVFVRSTLVATPAFRTRCCLRALLVFLWIRRRLPFFSSWTPERWRAERSDASSSSSGSGSFASAPR